MSASALISALAPAATDLALRPYQERALAAAVPALERGGRGTVVMACGTGKTVVFQQVAERLAPAAGRVLVLAPSLALVEQTYESWTRLAGRPFAAAVFCTADPAAPEDIGLDDVAAPVATTDPDVLAEWDEDHTGEFRVVFGTYHSTPNLQSLRGLWSWDLIVFDEAHRTTGAHDHAFTTALFDEKIPAQRRLFLTATPRVHTSTREDADDALASMDDEDLYGPRLFTYSFVEAIEDGWLSDYVVTVIAVAEDAPEVAALATGASAVHIGRGRAVTSAAVARGAAVLHAAREHDLHRVVSFHSRVQTARDFAQIVPAVADLTPGSLRVSSGTTNSPLTAEPRRAVLATLRGSTAEGLHLVTNARVLSEGVDVPTLDGVVFADPRTSAVEVTQIVGRAIRRNPNRSEPAVILVPVVVGPGDDVETRLKASDFRAVHQTIRALAEHDPGLLPALAQSSTAPEDRDARGPQRRIEYMTLGLLGDRTDDLAWTQHLHTLTIAGTGATWYQTAQQVADFAVSNGRYPTAGEHREKEERRLGQWVLNQRTYARKRSLAPERQAWLDEHLPGWGVGRDEQWFTTAQQVVQFISTHGRWPSGKAPDEDESFLGRWRGSQRAAKRAGTLSLQRLAWLDEHLPGWDVTRKSAEMWVETAQQVAHFVSAHRRDPSTTATDEGERRLGMWLSGQRKAALMNPEGFDFERRAWLDAHVPGWSAPRRRSPQPWSRTAQQVADFVAAHGAQPNKKSSSEAERHLGQWLVSQRTAARKNSLQGDRRAWLDQHVPGWEVTRVSPEWWFKTAQEVADFTTSHGRLPGTTKANKHEQRLGTWIAAQRTAARKNSLQGDRRAWLDEHLPGWKVTADDRWYETAKQVADFISTHGRYPRVTASGEERHLGRWMETQRTNASKGETRFTPERQSWLDEHLPDWSATARDRWTETAQEVVDFATAHNRQPNARSDDGRERRLGQWLSSQRTAARAGSLASERHTWLDEHMPGWGVGRDEQWFTTAQQVVDFATAQARSPSMTATDEDERRIGQWMANQRRDARKGLARFTPERRAWLDEHLPGWLPEK